jgi:hypothetical protein
MIGVFEAEIGIDGTILRKSGNGNNVRKPQETST